MHSISLIISNKISESFSRIITINASKQIRKITTPIIFSIKILINIGSIINRYFLLYISKTNYFINSSFFAKIIIKILPNKDHSIHGINKITNTQKTNTAAHSATKIFLSTYFHTINFCNYSRNIITRIKTPTTGIIPMIRFSSTKSKKSPTFPPF